MTVISRVYQQSTSTGNLFTGVLPAQDPVLDGTVRRWLERAQGGAFELDTPLVYRLERLYVNVKDAATFTVSLYHAFSASSLLLYSESSPEVTGNVLLVQQPGIILGPRDQIRIAAVGGGGAHLAELVVSLVPEE